MPPSRVKPYVRWGRKNDQTGAQACCEAVSRPSMQFVPLKSVPEPVALMTHRARPLLVEQHTQLGNSIRAPMAERGIIARRRPAGFAALLAMIEHPEDRHLPAEVRPILAVLAQQWRRLGRQIAALERQIIAWHKSNPDNLRLATIPIRPDLSSALVATAGEPKRFDSGRQFAAWVGLVPAQNSTGGKQRRGGVTKAGARHLRQLLVVAATGLIPRVRANPQISPWFARLLARMPPRKATVALANKMARRLGAARQTNDLPRAGCDRNRSSGLIAAGATPTASQPNARAMDHDEHRSVEPRFGPPRHVIELRARRNDYASPSADVIRASGHSAAHTGRTHDRTRPDGFFFPCTAWAVHT